MDLFNPTFDKHRNLLPQDGMVQYYGKLLSRAQATEYFNLLMGHINWRHDELVIHGKPLTTKRKVAWYGDQPYPYTYSNATKHALPWTPELAALKQVIEQASGETFNSCLLNLYHNGSEGMAWHSDAEKDLIKNGTIASLSLGAERKFLFKHKTSGLKVSVFLEDGSLLLMKGVTQTHWLHRLPPTTKSKRPRVNLTFRTIAEVK